MGYILKNTSGLINTKLTDTGRKKLSEGRFSISFFQIGDSEVSYNTLPSSYDQMDTNILEPEFNAQNSTGIPESNKHNIKYPYYVDAGSLNTYGVPFMDSLPSSVFNRAAMRGFFTGNITAETISWSALTNSQYAINSNYIVDMSTLICTDNIELILSSCYTDPVREPQAGDFITIFYDGKGTENCSCIYPTPTPTPSITPTISSTPTGITTTTTTTNPCLTPSPTPTPSSTCCPTPTPSPACPPPDPADCKVSIQSCYQTLTYRITRVCGNTIYLDRKTPDLSLYSGCFARVIVYPGSMNEIYDSYTPRPHWNDNVIDFESVCGLDAFDVKIWNMNIPWSENPAGLNPSISMDYTTFGSKTYLGTKEYLGYASSGGQVFYFPNVGTTATTDTFYYDSFGFTNYVEPEDQKCIAIIHYTNNTIDSFYGEKFALEPFDPQNPQDTTGQARNFKVHLPWLMWHKNPNCCNGETFYVDPEGFDGLDLFQVCYLQSLKNTDMNNPGIRYYHLWDTHSNLDGFPSRVGKVFPDHKIIVFDDEEIIAAMSYKSNRNWTYPAPQVSLITPNTCGNDNNSTVGILTGNNQTLYITYKLSDPSTCTENLHCNYYTAIKGPNINCNIVNPQNVAVRFGPEFSCLNTSPIVPNCWTNGFVFTFSSSTFNPDTFAIFKFVESGEFLNGQPIYISNPYLFNIYFDGSQWIFKGLLDEITIGSTPLGDINAEGTGISGYTSCDTAEQICFNFCNNNEPCVSQTFIQILSSGTTAWTNDNSSIIVTYSGSSNEYVIISGGTLVLGTLTGVTSNDYPVGTYTINPDLDPDLYPLSAITSTLGICDINTSCICRSFTANSGNSIIRYLDCGGFIKEETILDSQSFSGCIVGSLYTNLSGDTTNEICDFPCSSTTTTTTSTSTTTTTTCPPNCSIYSGYFASKFEIICQLVEGGGRPQSDEWKIIDFTDQISATTYNGYLTQSGLTGNTFVITLDEYNNAPYYDLDNYVSLTPVGYTGYSLNFGDEYYFYGNIETDIEATIYEMRYKINLSQSEFQLSSNPSWSSGIPTYITEIGLYDSKKDLMVISKLQSPVLRQGVQQLLVKFDF